MMNQQNLLYHTRLHDWYRQNSIYLHVSSKPAGLGTLTQDKLDFIHNWCVEVNQSLSLFKVKKKQAPPLFRRCHLSMSRSAYPSAYVPSAPNPNQGTGQSKFLISEGQLPIYGDLRSNNCNIPATQSVNTRVRCTNVDLLVHSNSKVGNTTCRTVVPVNHDSLYLRVNALTLKHEHNIHCPSYSSPRTDKLLKNGLSSDSWWVHDISPHSTRKSARQDSQQDKHDKNPTRGQKNCRSAHIRTLRQKGLLTSNTMEICLETEDEERRSLRGTERECGEQRVVIKPEKKGQVQKRWLPAASQQNSSERRMSFWHDPQNDGSFSMAEKCHSENQLLAPSHPENFIYKPTISSISLSNSLLHVLSIDDCKISMRYRPYKLQDQAQVPLQLTTPSILSLDSEEKATSKLAMKMSKSSGSVTSLQSSSILNATIQNKRQYRILSNPDKLNKQPSSASLAKAFDILIHDRTIMQRIDQISSIKKKKSQPTVTCAFEGPIYCGMQAALRQHIAMILQDQCTQLRNKYQQQRNASIRKKYVKQTSPECQIKKEISKLIQADSEHLDSNKAMDDMPADSQHHDSNRSLHDMPADSQHHDNNQSVPP